MRRPRVSNEDFVVAWASSRDLDDVVAATSMGLPAIKAKARILARAGVNLPELRKRDSNRLDQLAVAQLNSLIKKHNRTDR